MKLWPLGQKSQYSKHDNRSPRPVSIHQGHRRPSWFDVTRHPPNPNEFDEQAISESIGLIEDLILSQVHSGIDSRRIVLAGFSQGAALGMMVALSTLHYLGGVVSLSGWIPHRARHVRCSFVILKSYYLLNYPDVDDAFCTKLPYPLVPRSGRQGNSDLFWSGCSRVLTQYCRILTLQAADTCLRRPGTRYQ